MGGEIYLTKNINKKTSVEKYEGRSAKNFGIKKEIETTHATNAEQLLIKTFYSQTKSEVDAHGWEFVVIKKIEELYKEYAADKKVEKEYFYKQLMLLGRLFRDKAAFERRKKRRQKKETKNDKQD